MNGRVLIVDDEPANAELLEGMLAQYPDLMVKSINDSRLAEREFIEFEPDLVLLDLHMPEPDGLELLRRLRGARISLGYLPVIVLSAAGFLVARDSGLGLGARALLLQPLLHAEVLLRVRNLLHTRQLYMELASAKEALEQHEAQGRKRPKDGSA